jgi:demethylmenaquinone methyltransferase/2-methoxy-6-polyprenyl-1,4-benzoquinol methylase
MSDREKQKYFDDLAPRWDLFTDHNRVRGSLRKELDRLRLSPEEHVLDLGCGTGNLTAVLLERLGPAACVTAVDFSSTMLEVARAKLPDPRVHWCLADAAVLPLRSESCDRVVCFSAWPHFADPRAVLVEMNRILRLNGFLTILHIEGRTTINRIHASAGGAVEHDLLSTVQDLAELFPSAGFVVDECDDRPERYSITGRKHGGVQ